MRKKQSYKGAPAADEDDLSSFICRRRMIMTLRKEEVGGKTRGRETEWWNWSTTVLLQSGVVRSCRCCLTRKWRNILRAQTNTTTLYHVYYGERGINTTFSGRYCRHHCCWLVPKKVRSVADKKRQLCGTGCQKPKAHTNTKDLKSENDSPRHRRRHILIYNCRSVSDSKLFYQLK